MKDLLEWMVRGIVDYPDHVEINQKTENDFTIYTLKVHPLDMGKVIGREGKIIKALRNLLKIPAIIQKKKVTLALIEEDSIK